LYLTKDFAFLKCFSWTWT